MPIYMIQVGEDGPVKIGFADNPAKRLKHLQTARAEPLRLVRILDGTQADERLLHRRFAKRRIRLEWFRPTHKMLTGNTGFLDLPLPDTKRMIRASSSCLGRYRRSVGFTIDQLAEKWGFPRTTLHSWETMKRTPALATALKIKELSGGKVKPEDFARASA